MKDDVHVCFPSFVAYDRHNFQRIISAAYHPKNASYLIPCRFSKQIMLYHDQREKAVKLLLSSNFD